MARLLLLTALLVFAVLPQPSGAARQHFGGVWRQIHSNAGECRTCRLDIRQMGPSLAIIANNGWSATGEAGDAGNADLARGSGRWRPNTRATYAGSPFEIRLVLNDDYLHMTMHVAAREGGRRTIRAIFERATTSGT
ncbi:hypothetical protein [Sinorhizobium sp. BG8]|uniref:hypothetical protein n=1 Tax=Sinorhizobium sp. BG8 TaxID=2613773 RepID=UPI00193D0F6B|nr:hypothetical protein [Sinorhizobium sp. BG8]QRM56609.1 hypothetical protein F3Y30_20275 [Sinorhizobium sp. BG8]